MADTQTPPQERERNDPHPPKPSGCMSGGCGCLLAAALLCLGLCAAAWWQRDALLTPGGPWERFRDWVEAHRTNQASAPLEEARQGVRNIQESLDSALNDGEDISKRLETLRRDIAQRRDGATESLRRHWEALASRAEALWRRTREGSDTLREEVEELARQVRQLQGVSGDTQERKRHTERRD